MDQSRRLLTVSETAEKLRMSTQAVLRLCQRNEIPAHKFGRLWRIDETHLEEMLKPRDYDAPVR